MRADRPLILGHRGDRRRKRENTIEAFEEALRVGADGIEFDVRRTRSGLVLHHDAELRIRGRRHALASLAQDELPSWLSSLTDVSEWGQGRDAIFDVEIKEAGDEAAIVRALRPVLPRCVFTSFLPDVVFTMRRLLPEAKVGWITKAEPDAALAVATELRPTLVVLPARRCSGSLVDAFHELGSEVWAWNVNSAPLAQRLVKSGVAALITDDPKRLCAWRDGLARPQKGPRRGRRES